MQLCFNRLGRLAILVCGGFALAACSALQAMEPVLAPPSLFQLDRTVAVEFVDAAAAGHRCAERGVVSIGLPGFSSSACGSRDLITLPDPCAVSDEAYAWELCAYAGDAGRARQIMFVHPDLAAGRCRSLGRRDVASGVIACETHEAIVAVNPCLYAERGWFADIACHELAHANGWAADHPGGRLGTQPAFVQARLAPEDILPPEAVCLALLEKAAKGK